MAFFTGVARSQNGTRDTSYLDHFDDKPFLELNSADSSDAPPLGTKITSANWQQYRKFLPLGVQAFLSGRYFWQIGSGPDHYIEVGPTIKTALPTKYLADTEKYAGQAQLVKLPNGAPTISKITWQVFHFHIQVALISEDSFFTTTITHVYSEHLSGLLHRGVGG